MKRLIIIASIISGSAFAGNLNTARCFNMVRSQAAADLRINVANSIKLCSENGSLETAACFGKARESLNVADSIALCHGGNMGNVECFNKVRTQEYPNTELNIVNAIALCASPTPASFMPLK